MRETVEPWGKTGKDDGGFMESRAFCDVPDHSTATCTTTPDPGHWHYFKFKPFIRSMSSSTTELLVRPFL